MRNMYKFITKQVLSQEESERYTYIYGGSGVNIINDNNEFVYKAVPIIDESKYNVLRKQYEWLKQNSDIAVEPYGDGILDGDQGRYYYYVMKHYDRYTVSDLIKKKTESVQYLAQMIDNIIISLNTRKQNDLEFDISSYRNRLITRVNEMLLKDDVKQLFDTFNIIPLLEKYHTIFKSYESMFSKQNLQTCYHGDFTVENMFVDEGKIRLFDPAFTMHYSSIILDIGKLYQSLHFCYEEYFDHGIKVNDNVKNTEKMIVENIQLFRDVIAKNEYKKQLYDSLIWTDQHKLGLLMEASHYIRMLPFKFNLGYKQLLKNVIVLKHSLQSCIEEC